MNDVSRQTTNGCSTEKQEVGWHERMQTVWCGRRPRSPFLSMSQCAICLVWVRDTMGWNCSPISLVDFLSEKRGIPGRARSRKMTYILAGVAQVLWKVRNDWVFTNKLISSPTILPCRIVGVMQNWGNMESRRDLVERKETLGKLQDGLGLL